MAAKMVQSDKKHHSTNVKIRREFLPAIKATCGAENLTLSMLVGQALNMRLGKNVEIGDRPIVGRKIGWRKKSTSPKKSPASKKKRGTR